MNERVSLVYAHDELGAALYRRRPLAPAGVEVVCLLSNGQLVPATQLGAFRSYRRRYDVNTADHFHSETVTLPARNDAFEFQGSMDIGWRVTDAVKVVERNVGDGLALVRSTLLTRMRQISRRFEVEQCAAADEEVNRTLGSAPVTLSEGITVHRFAARLTLDAQTRAYLQQSRNHDYEASLDQRRIEATRRALDGDNALLVLHLSKHRDDTSSIIDILAKDRNTSEQRRIELFRELLAKGVIQDVDLDELIRALVKQSTAAVLDGPAGAPKIGSASGQFSTATIVPGAIAPVPALETAPEPVPAQAELSTSQPSTANGGVATWKPVGKGKA